MKYNILGTTDLNVSHVALGGAAFSDIYGKYNEKNSISLVQNCHALGINYFETGPWYGQGTSERLLGKALKEIPRDSFYIGSKVGRYDKEVDRMFDFSAERTAAGVDTTLERLGMDYVDLIQVHDLSFAPSTSVILNETLPALANAVRDGKARYIGLADYDIELMKEIIEESETKISAILSYAKSTLLDNRLQNYVPFFKGRGIGIINAAATGMGLLCNAGEKVWHPADADIKLVCRQIREHCAGKGIETARLATWFSLKQPGIATNVCGFTTEDQLKDTLKIYKKGLTAIELEALNYIQENYLQNAPFHWDDVEVMRYKEKKKNKTAMFG